MCRSEERDDKESYCKSESVGYAKELEIKSGLTQSQS